MSEHQRLLVEARKWKTAHVYAESCLSVINGRTLHYEYAESYPSVINGRTLRYKYAESYPSVINGRTPHMCTCMHVCMIYSAFSGFSSFSFFSSFFFFFFFSFGAENKLTVPTMTSPMPSTKVAIIIIKG